MKIRLNKTTLAEMPAPVRALVESWSTRHRKRFISVENSTGFYAAENARITMINLATGKTASAQAAGDFAGMTQLSPTDKIPLAPGIVAIEDGFFCGVPFLQIHQGTDPCLQHESLFQKIVDEAFENEAQRLEQRLIDGDK